MKAKQTFVFLLSSVFMCSILLLKHTPRPVHTHRVHRSIKPNSCNCLSTISSISSSKLLFIVSSLFRPTINTVYLLIKHLNLSLKWTTLRCESQPPSLSHECTKRIESARIGLFAFWVTWSRVFVTLWDHFRNTCDDLETGHYTAITFVSQKLFWKDKTAQCDHSHCNLGRDFHHLILCDQRNN